MAYCAVADVENLMAVTFTGTSRPTTEEVGDAITSISADMDGVLAAAGYTIPVTDTDALAMLKQYAVMGTAARAWHTGYASNQEPPRVTYWRSEYSGFISRVRKGEQVLPGGLESSVEDISICGTLWRSDSEVTRE